MLANLRREPGSEDDQSLREVADPRPRPRTRHLRLSREAHLLPCAVPDFISPRFSHRCALAVKMLVIDLWAEDRCHASAKARHAPGRVE